MPATKARTNWLSDRSAGAGNSQTTGQGLAAAAATSATVLPKPAGAQTRVNGPVSPSRRRVVSRGRAITSDETRGRRGVVGTILSGNGTSPGGTEVMNRDDLVSGAVAEGSAR